MNVVLSIDNYLKLPNEILAISRRDGNILDLLSPATIKLYYKSTLRNEFVKLFNRLKETLYLYTSDVSSLTTTKYEDTRVSYQGYRTNDKVSAMVEKSIKEQNWAANFYNQLLESCKKLSSQEASYLVGSFLLNKSEETMSEELMICRATLTKIKKSCLVKLYLDLIMKNKL